MTAARPWSVAVGFGVGRVERLDSPATHAVTLYAECYIHNKMCALSHVGRPERLRHNMSVALDMILVAVRNTRVTTSLKLGAGIGPVHYVG
jgi:hypothetical protein